MRALCLAPRAKARCVRRTQGPSRRFQNSPLVTSHSPLRRNAPLSHECHRARLVLRQRTWLVNGHGTLPTLQITLGAEGILSELLLVRPLPLVSPRPLCRGLDGQRTRRMDRRGGLAVKKNRRGGLTPAAACMLTSQLSNWGRRPGCLIHRTPAFFSSRRPRVPAWCRRGADPRRVRRR